MAKRTILLPKGKKSTADWNRMKELEIINGRKSMAEMYSPYGERSAIQYALKRRREEGKQCPIPIRTYCVNDYVRSNGVKVKGYCVAPHRRKCKR